MRFWHLVTLIPLFVGIGSTGNGLAQSNIPVVTFATADWDLRLAILDDDLAEIQYSSGKRPDSAPTIMVSKTDYPGPTVFQTAPHTLTTREMDLRVNPVSLCVTVTDLLAEVELTTICPRTSDATLGLSLAQNGTTHLYGLGEQFPRRGGTDGDWINQRRFSLNLYGNSLVDNNGGHVGSAQFPILYALGAEYENYAFFFDDVYQQYWDFTGDPFTVTTTNPERLHGYIMTGPDLPDLRSDYLELTGKPPVPPRTMFGLWVSEYGYENWAELEAVLASLENSHFPVDGFVLDLQWFGGIGENSQMGSLSWDTTNFPDPAETIAALERDHGVYIMPIEESYAAAAVADYEQLAASGVLVRRCEAIECGPVTFAEWWGSGGMVDWSDPAVSAFWHDTRRQPLIDDGVIGHWTDLGEPEDYSDAAWYARVPHNEAGIHNIYNLLWAQGIWEGYQRNAIQQRPFILSRSGTSGIQRFGTSMWSGDIAANMPSLEGHMFAQMHMSLSGVDYFGADVGGFYRNVGDPVIDANTMYTLWLANAALLDVPIRPHALNLENRYQTAPSLVGDVDSNRANIQLRYELIPYLYTLAHQAYRDGDAIFAPLVYHFQTDLEVRQLGSHKMLGNDLLMRTLTGYVYDSLPVYLPAGGWFNYYTGAFVMSDGAWFDTPTMVNNLQRVPLFVRDGAIIPTQFVDDQTMNAAGRRRDGSIVPDLAFTIHHGAQDSGSFTLIEDDGLTTAYQFGAIRETPLSFETTDSTMTIMVGAASGHYDGAPDQRFAQVTIVNAESHVISELTWNGELLPKSDSPIDPNAATNAYFLTESGSIVVRLGPFAATGDQLLQISWVG